MFSLQRFTSCRASATRPPGSIAQPVRSLLRSWGEPLAAIGALMALLALPWTIKPVFGLLSDFVPLFGSRRRKYLLLANGAAAVSLFLLAFVPIEPGSLWLLFALLLPTTMAIALGDVIVDALMVEKGQPLGLTGRFQSIQWASANAALLLAGVLGGYIAQERLQSLAFGLCGALWVFAFAVTWRYGERPGRRSSRCGKLKRDRGCPARRVARQALSHGLRPTDAVELQPGLGLRTLYPHDRGSRIFRTGVW